MSHVHKSDMLHKKWNRYAKKYCPKCKKEFDHKKEECPVCRENLVTGNFKDAI